MGNVGSSVYGAWSILGTKSQDILASAAAILTISVFKSVSCKFPKFMEVQYWIAGVPL